MSNPHRIERKIDRAREDLEANLGELKDVVQDKLDVKKQVRDAVDRRKADAREFIARTRDGIREQPMTAVIIAVGVIGLAVAVIMVGRRRSRRAA